MTDPLAGVEFTGSAGQPDAAMGRILGCGSLLGLLVLTASLFLVGVWANVAWWFLKAGWNLIGL